MTPTVREYWPSSDEGTSSQESSLVDFVQFAGKDPEKWKRIIGASLVSIHPERGTGVVQRVFKNVQGLLCLHVQYANGESDVNALLVAKYHKDVPIVISAVEPPPFDGEIREATSLPSKGRIDAKEPVKAAEPEMQNARLFVAFAGQELSRWQMLVGQLALVVNKPRPVSGVIESVSEHLRSIRLMIRFKTVPRGPASPQQILKISVSDAMHPWIVPFSHGWTAEAQLEKKYYLAVRDVRKPLSQAETFSRFAGDNYKTWKCLCGLKVRNHHQEAKIFSVYREAVGIVLKLRYRNGELGKLYASDLHRVLDEVTIPKQLAQRYRRFSRCVATAHQERQGSVARNHLH